jgi:ABC-2 type transport system ATP-binding protein
MNHMCVSFKQKQQFGIKDLLIHGRKCHESIVKIDALRDITLTVENGDRVGIIGHNGAGKSTLLKTVGGIYAPTAGTLSVEGKPTCLFELATGFEMEATGITNIRLRALMLGMSPQEIERKTAEIAEFSGLGEHLYRPVKYYSSGMFLRLAFSVSTAVNPEILLLDEIVAAGDAGFIDKANRRMNEMTDSVDILLFVSHSMDQIRKFCNRCVWISGGRILMEGGVDEVTSAYQKAMAENPTNPEATLTSACG